MQVGKGRGRGSKNREGGPIITNEHVCISFHASPTPVIYTQQWRWQLATSLQHPEETNSDWLTSRKSCRSFLALVFFPTMLVYHRTFERTHTAGHAG